MKLNLGCGNQHIKGFLNVDLCDNSDFKHDLRLPLPFENKSIDEIMAIHVIESFYQWEFPEILRDWARVLKGTLTIEFTELMETALMYIYGIGQEKISGHWGLYGDQSKPIDPLLVHRYVYEKSELEGLLRDTGFENIIFSKEFIAHHSKRDLRVSCSI